jgi:response regulator RpfG family c-di-GMP phosphodiesterase
MMSYQPDPLLSLHHGPGAILVAAGDHANRNAMARHLARLGHQVLEACSGAEVLDRLHARGIAGLVLDLDLPEEMPLGLLPRILERDPNLAVVVISEQTDAQTASLCMRQGAFDFLTKPVEGPVLERALERALNWRARVMTDRETQKLLRAEVAERAEMIRQERAKLQQLAESSLQTLVAVMEAKDPFFSGHSLRVGQMAASIAAKMGRTDQEVEQVRMAGTLHDLGMIAVSAQVTGKAGPLTAEEFDDVKRHPAIGAQLLAPYPDLAQIARFVRGHHERWDGAGYPDGLARQEIPWGARVLAAAEIYDAMTSTRAYRDRISPDEVLELMHALVGETLDPGIFEALAEVIGRRQALEFVESDHQQDAVEKLIVTEVAPHAA